MSYSQGKELTSEGKEELRMLARRFQNKFRDLLSVPYSESHYYVSLFAMIITKKFHKHLWS